tara:strand:- start:6739 stop:7746 length:1008 start_codon:yes stop_codon:yes gene_type:complete
MGKLRKIGKSIKKRVKKLFSSKIGSIVGSIALSMILGPVIGRAFNGVKTALGFGQQATTQAATQAATQQVTEEAVKKGVEGSITDVAGEELITKNIAEQAAEKELGKSITSESLKSAIDAGATNLDKAANFTEQFTQGTLQGDIPLMGNTSITDSLNDVNNYLETGQMFNQEITQRQLQGENLRFAEDVFSDAYEKEISSGGYGLSGVGGVTPKQIEAGVPLSTKITSGRVGQLAMDVGGDIVSGFTGEDFLPDVTKGVVGSVASQMIMGEGEEQFARGNIPMGQPQMEAAQGAYVAEVQNQIPNIPATNFQQMNQSLFYGTLSPQYLMGQAQYT